MAKWLIKKAQADIKLMTEILKISPVTAQVLANRGINTRNKAVTYLKPDLRHMKNPLQNPSLENSQQNPFHMRDFERACEIISSSIMTRDKIVIYGDYDVDGVMSTVILYKTLKNLGADVSYYIPDRESEGYGLNIGAVRSLKECETDLIVTCDNGISALEEVLEVLRLGMKIVVIDHHEPGFLETESSEKLDIIPEAHAVVDPKQKSCPYPFKQLCAAGLCYKLSKYLHAYNNVPFKQEYEFLVLASIATVCDVVDLLDENRVIVKYGLEAINTKKDINLGLARLIEKRGYKDKRLTDFEWGYIIGPCINATGRLERATLAVELFTSTNDAECVALAEKLCVLNDERKYMTQKAYENAAKTLSEGDNKDVIKVIYDGDIHESIAGIVAGRIKDAVYRPTVVITRGEQMAKGSARSIEGYNIFEALLRNKDLLERFGGHEMAAGLSILEENIELLRRRLNEQCILSPDDLEQKIRIDMELDLNDVTYALAEELKTLAPFGKGNREPVFGTRGLTVEQIRMIDEKSTMIFTFRQNDSLTIRGVCFGLNDKFKQAIEAAYDSYTAEKILHGILRSVDLALDVVYTIDINEYNGNVSVQLRIKDFRLSICSALNTSNL